MYLTTSTNLIWSSFSCWSCICFWRTSFNWQISTSLNNDRSRTGLISGCLSSFWRVNSSRSLSLFSSVVGSWNTIPALSNSYISVETIVIANKNNSISVEIELPCSGNVQQQSFQVNQWIIKDTNSFGLIDLRNHKKYLTRLFWDFAVFL